MLREVQAANTSEQPLEIRGGQLTIDGLESGTAHIVLSGAGPGEPRGSKKAQLTGRGTTVLTRPISSACTDSYGRHRNQNSFARFGPTRSRSSDAP